MVCFVVHTGGESYEALRYGVHTTYSDTHPHNLVYNSSGGLGFLDGFLIDAHFRYLFHNKFITESFFHVREHYILIWSSLCFAL